MATREIKTTLALDGEREYKQAVKDISKELSVLNSEMKLVDERYKDNADSIEALTEKGQTLDKTLTEQRKKVDAIRDALENAAEQFGEADKRTKEWQVKLNDAERAVIKTERAVKDNNEALEDAAKRLRDVDGAQENATLSTKEFGRAQEDTGRGSVSLADAIGGVADKLGINLPDGARNALDSMGGVSSGMAGLASGAVAVAVAIYKVIDALSELTIEQAKAAQEIQVNSQIMGMSTQEYQEWDFVLKTVGSSAEEAQGDLSQLAEKAMDAASGAGEGAELFAKMGVEVRNADGTLKSQNQILTEVITSLQGMADETERNAIASALLSTTGERLVPILNQSAAETAALKERAHELGVVMSEETLGTLNQVNESMLTFNSYTEGAKNKVAAEFAPALKEVMEIGGELVEKIGEFVNDSGLTDLLGVILELVGNVLDVLGPLLDILTPIATAVIEPIVMALAALADVITLVVSLVKMMVEAFKALFGIEPDMGWWEDMKGIFTGDSATARAMAGFNATGTDYWRGGLTWVGEQGPELVSLPRGSQIFSNQDSMQMMGSNNYYITIDANNIREFNDIVRIAQTERISKRMGYVGR